MKAIYLSILYSTVITLGSVVTGAAQQVKIDRQQYFAAYDAADLKSRAVYPRRERRVVERFENGKSVSRQTYTYEYAAQDRWSHTVEFSEKGKVTLKKYVQIGGDFYCQEGQNPFKRSKSPCEPVSMSMSPDPDSQEFSVRRSSSGNETVYRMYTLRSYAPTSNAKPKVFSFEQVFTVQPDGRFSGFDTQNGIVTEPSEIYSKSTIRYEYSVPIPTIEPPTSKASKRGHQPGF